MDLSHGQVALLTTFLVLIAAVAFNLGDITGSVVATGAETVIKVNPVLVNSGEDLRINVYPSDEGNSNKIEFFRGGSKIADSSELCAGRRCYDDTLLIYNVPGSWEAGTYVAQVYDYAGSNYVQAFFNVE